MGLAFDLAAAVPAEVEVAPIAAEDLVDVGPADQEVPASAGIVGHLVPVVVEVVAAAAAPAAAGPSCSALEDLVPAEEDVGRKNLEGLPDEDREAFLAVPVGCIQVDRHNSEEDSLPAVAAGLPVGPAAAARHIRKANTVLPAADPAHCRAQKPSDPPSPGPAELGR